MGEIIQVDLHMHSVYSDGTMVPKDLVFENSLIGNAAVALTDHDSMKGVEDFLLSAKLVGTEGITGVEISTSRYHILGYFVDIYNDALIDLVDHAASVQNKIAELRVDKIQKAGVPITYEKVVYHHPMARLGKANIANTLLLDRDCREYFINEYGRMLNGREIFDIYLKKGSVGGWVRGPKPPRARETIEVIHGADGIAGIAHPFKDADSPDDLHTLVEFGLDAVESQPTFGKRNDPYLEYANQCSLLVTYGSDFHGPHFPRPMLMNNGNRLEKFW